MKPLLKVSEVAELLGCSEITVRRQIASGRLHAVLIGGKSLRIRGEVLDGAALSEIVTGPLLATNDLCRLFRVTRWTVYAWEKSGVLKLQREGGRPFLPREDLQGLIRDYVPGKPKGVRDKSPRTRKRGRTP